MGHEIVALIFDIFATKLVLNFYQNLIQIYTENWVNSPGQQEDNSWQAFVIVPKGDWYIAKASCFPRYLAFVKQWLAQLF